MKRIKQLLALVAATAIMLLASLPVGALAPVIIGDTNEDLSIDILDLVYASYNSPNYFEAIDYDVDGQNDFDLFRAKLLSEEAESVVEYAVNIDYFDLLDEE